MTEAGEGRPFVSGVVLAAGASTRMGKPKQLLPMGDRCLLQWVLDAALASCLDEVIVVLGHRADEIGRALALDASDRISLVSNPDWAEGQSTSLRCGLGAADARAQAAAVLLGDQPGVEARLIDALVAAYLASGARGARPVYPDAGGAPGHPVVLGRPLWPELMALSGDRGARGLLADRPDWLLPHAVAGQPPADVDTWEEYRRIAGG